MLLSSYHHLVWLTLIENNSVLFVLFYLYHYEQVKYETETVEQQARIVNIY